MLIFRSPKSDLVASAFYIFLKKEEEYLERYERAKNELVNSERVLRLAKIRVNCYY
jgi:hypothetical protein